MSEIINKLELVYGTVASFNILMQNFHKLHQGKTEKVSSIGNTLGGGAECGSARISYDVEHRQSPEVPER